MQLDEAARGFSFRFDGPLDMRMAQDGLSAAEIINDYSEEVLADIFYHYGEERASRRIARAIAHDRKAAPFVTTGALAGLIARIMPGKPGDMHPATRVFQALRIAVNDELGELLRALYAAERVLKPGGRLAIVTFHSLEDRIVKQFFAARSGKGAAVSRHMPGAAAQAPATFTLLSRQPVTPGAAELAINPRARSAKLRAGERTSAPVAAPDARLAALAQLPVAGRR
jgi:16S rRNA (cytosine1402-N4)-methyltransferase